MASGYLVHPSLRLAPRWHMRSRTRKRSTESGMGLGDEGIIPPPALSQRAGLPRRCLGNGVLRQAQPAGSPEVCVGCAGAVLPRGRGCARSALRPSGSFRRATEKVSPSSPGGSESLAVSMCFRTTLTKSRGEGKEKRSRGRSPDTLARVRSWCL